MRPSPLVTFGVRRVTVEKAAYQACLTYHNPYYNSLINKPSVCGLVRPFITR